MMGARSLLEKAKDCRELGREWMGEGEEELGEVHREKVQNTTAYQMLMLRAALYELGAAIVQELENVGRAVRGR